MTNIIRSSEGTDVNIRKLGDAKALEDFGQARQADALTNEFHILPTVEKPIAGSHEPRGTYKYGGLLKESAAGRREWLSVAGLRAALRPCIASRALPYTQTEARAARSTVLKTITTKKATCDPTNHHQNAASIKTLRSR